MGGATASFKFTITSFPFFLTITTTLILIHPCNTVIAGSNDESNEDVIPLIVEDNRPPPSAVGHHGEMKSDALKPSAVVVVGVLTTTFSLSFLLLLYIKHCNNGGTTFVVRGSGSDHNPQVGGTAQQQRKHSGVDREVVESLPMFRFGSLSGQKDGLECAVCLTGFEDQEVLRLLPKCRHAFHVDCVDTWLHAHSTCPLCRYKVHRQDMVDTREKKEGEEASDNDVGVSPENENRRVSGSNSSEEFLEIVLQTPKNDTETPSFKGSWEEEGVVACPRKNGGSLGGKMSGDHRLKHQIIFSPSVRGGVHEGRSDVDVEPLDVLYLKSEMIISDGRRTKSAHKQDDVAAVGSNEAEDGVLRSMSEMTGMSRFLRGKNKGKGRG